MSDEEAPFRPVNRDLVDESYLTRPWFVVRSFPHLRTRLAPAVRFLCS